MSSSKKLIIVGAGISGLSAGVYAARSGFDVTILEQHATFGGLSTAWSRKGYYFEGGMHWLTGSSPDLPMNRLWKETGALKENNPVENRDPLYTVLVNGKSVSLYRDIEKTRSSLLEFAPEDKKMINRYCNDVKAFVKFHMPVFDVAGCKCKTPAGFNPMEYIQMLPAVAKVPRLAKISYEDYVNQFKNENLRHLLLSVIGYRYNALSFIYTMGSFSSGDCGYPAGGSVRMGQNMLDTYKSLGGKIEFCSKVEKVISENGKVKSVKTTKAEIPADAVIVTQDARMAIDNLFEPELQEPWIGKMRKSVVSEQNMMISIGVKADLSHLPYCCVFPLNKPFEYAGCRWNELRVYNYAKYKDYAPEGCTAVTCLLIGDSYKFWKAAKEDGTYKTKKDEIAKLYIETLSNFIPEIKDAVEAIDVTTPCTYQRYCGSYEGSWMSVWTAEGKQDNYPQKAKTVEGLYFAGERMRMPGGLPIAVFTGRQAVQYLCKDTGTLFI